ncbi:MAG: hypothetical protein ABIQ18_06880 [Umezawaea sp.]
MTLPNVGVIGRSQSGKDTVAAYLVRHHGYVRVALADPLRDLALALDPLVADGVRLGDVVASLGWERAKSERPEVRRTLQRLGTDVIRRGFGPDVWARKCLAAIERHNAVGRPVVVPDVRFPNERALLAELSGAVMWRVVRSTAPAVLAHESEDYADALPVDAELPNERSLADLYSRVERAVAELKGAPAHHA